jgi:hypothetical protein
MRAAVLSGTSVHTYQNAQRHRHTDAVLRTFALRYTMFKFHCNTLRGRCMQTHTPHTHTHTPTHTHTQTHTHTHNTHTTHTHKHTNTHTQTYTHAHKHTNTHTNTHAHTNTRKHISATLNICKGQDTGPSKICDRRRTENYINKCSRIVTTAQQDRYILLPSQKSVSDKGVKVKCTLVQALRLCTGRTAHRSSGIALLSHDHGTKRGWGVSVTPRPLFTPGKDPVPIVQGTGWAPGPVWTGAESLAPTGIRSPDRPSRSQSLYRLSYPAHSLW